MHVKNLSVGDDKDVDDIVDGDKDVDDIVDGVDVHDVGETDNIFHQVKNVCMLCENVITQRHKY